MTNIDSAKLFESYFTPINIQLRHPMKTTIRGLHVITLSSKTYTNVCASGLINVRLIETLR